MPLLTSCHDGIRIQYEILGNVSDSGPARTITLIWCGT
jgi:hypothetical protein